MNVADIVTGHIGGNYDEQKLFIRCFRTYTIYSVKLSVFCCYKTILIKTYYVIQPPEC